MLGITSAEAAGLCPKCSHTPYAPEPWKGGYNSLKGWIKTARQKVEQAKAATALPATIEASPAIEVQVDGEAQPAALEPPITIATDAEMADITAAPENIAQPTTEVSNL